MSDDADDKLLPPLYARYAELAKHASGAEEQPVWCPHNPHQKQREFLALNCREAMYGGAAGGGKSDALLMDVLQNVHVEGYSAILFRKTYKDLALPGALMDRAFQWLSPTKAHWNGIDKQWRFPSGAVLTFGYLDGPLDRHRYQGAEFQYVGFDELTQFQERDYTYLSSRIRKLAGVDLPLKLRAATNPGGVGHDWVMRRFITEPDGRVFIPAKLDDNPYLDQESYDESLAALDPVTRQQLRDGLWIRDPSGLVYYSWDDSRNTIETLPSLPDSERWHFIFAADFGVTDPTAFAVWAFSDHDACAYLVESDQWEGLAPSEAAEIAQRWVAKYNGFDRMVGDIGGLGKGFEAEWRQRFYLPLKAAQKTDKLGYIKLFNGDLANGKIRVVRAANEQLVTDLRALPWADEKHLKEHPGSPNHLPDAALYGWREVRSFDWTVREVKPKTELDIKKAEMAERKRKIIERTRRGDEDPDAWILGPP